MKVFRWKSGYVYRSSSSWTENPNSAKLYSKAGFVKNAAHGHSHVVVEILEVEKLGEMPLENFKEEF